MPLLSEISSLLGLPEMPGAGSTIITGVAALAEAGSCDLSLISAEKYLPQLEQTKAAAVLAQRKVHLPSGWTRPALVVDDVELALTRVLPLFAPPISRPEPGIHPTAQIAPSATISSIAALGPHVTIGKRAKIGDGCVLHANVVIGDDVVLGERCELFANVVVRERVTLGARVTIHAGSVIGMDGFGYRWDGKQHVKVPHVGTVLIEDDVEIGSCVCVDRAKFGSTRIGRGTKIDNLVQVAHNVQIGPHCIIVGQTGLAGSCRLGTGVVIGGQAAIRDHIQMGDGAMAAACSAVAEDVPPKSIVSGTPALPHRQSLREQGLLRRLPGLFDQVRKMQEQLAKPKNDPPVA
jgi:UDP-3-O-[3-hydroxymyristoyl] glucosamine N-acyltransferase